MNPTISGVIGRGFLNQVPTLNGSSTMRMKAKKPNPEASKNPESLDSDALNPV